MPTVYLRLLCCIRAIELQARQAGVIFRVNAHHRSSGLTIRSVLVLGFGLTFGLWLFSGYYFTRRVTELQQDSARVTGRYIRAQARLSAVRSQVLRIRVCARRPSRPDA